MITDFYVFTDASFDKKSKMAVIGFFKCNDLASEHDKTPNSIHLQKICETNNIRAEIQSALTAIASCSKGSRITLHTDCQTICELPRRREKLEAKNFISKSKATPLTNADLYKEFYQIMDLYQIRLVWMKGHTSGTNLTAEQKIFSNLDIAVRDQLRTLRARMSQNKN